MFSKMLSKIASRGAVAVLIVLSSVLFAGVSYAGRGPLPKHDPPCTVNPNPAAVGQAYTVSASGLPTTDPVWLISQAPNGSSTVSEVYVSSDGSWSGARVADQAGTWTYTFSGLMANNKYGAVSTCTEQVS